MSYKILPALKVSGKFNYQTPIYFSGDLFYQPSIFSSEGYYRLKSGYTPKQKKQIENITSKLYSGEDLTPKEELLVDHEIRKELLKRDLISSPREPLSWEVQRRTVSEDSIFSNLFRGFKNQAFVEITVDGIDYILAPDDYPQSSYFIEILCRTSFEEPDSDSAEDERPWLWCEPHLIRLDIDEHKHSTISYLVEIINKRKKSGYQERIKKNQKILNTTLKDVAPTDGTYWEHEVTLDDNCKCQITVRRVRAVGIYLTVECEGKAVNDIYYNEYKDSTIKQIIDVARARLSEDSEP